MLSFLAAASLFAVAVYGLPAIVDRLAPLVPQGIERRLGNAADVQVRAMLDKGPMATARSNAETPPVEKAGHAAFEKLMARLQTAASLRLPLQAAVIRREEANAIALPGGHIYVFKGLIDQAETVDEVAGVIAHELGHVANRDGTRAIVQATGLSLIFGILLGDFVGGGAVVLASESLLKSAYSRSAERRADDYAVRHHPGRRRRSARARPVPGPNCRQSPRRVDISRPSGHPRSRGPDRCHRRAAKWWRNAA